MSETTPAEIDAQTDASDDEPTGDEIRQHAQDPAEGADPDADQGDAVPREHTQDPAEG
jgi:hypothetical protein